MATRIVLDPVEVSSSRTELTITSWVGEAIDWGDAAIEAYMAEASRGQIPIDFRVPNRIVQIPLILKTVGGSSFTTIRTQIQAKVALFQREGGWVKRTGALGDVFADVVNATLHLGGTGFMEDTRLADLEATLSLECLPDWYGAEVDLGVTTETTAAELRKVMATVKGNYSGRARIVVNELQGASQLGLIWGLRSANYSSDSTAALAYEAELLTPKDAAGTGNITGASGGSPNVVTHLALTSSWTPVLSTQILSGSAHMTHVGTYRVWARVHSTTSALPKVRLLWDVGDLVLPEENASWQIPSASSFYLADLGEIRLDPVPAGTHRWQGLIQGQGAGANLSIDKLWLVPVDDGYGALSATTATSDGLTSYSARDGFDQSAGGLNGKILPVGGSWNTVGDSDDFNVSGAGVATRAVTNDTGAGPVGRVAAAGTTVYTNVMASVDMSFAVASDVASTGKQFGLMLRYVDGSNWVAVGPRAKTASGSKVLTMTTMVAGVESYLHSDGTTGINDGPTDSTFALGAAAATIQCIITAAGQFTVSLNGVTKITGSNSVLATGGALASGKSGIYDQVSNHATPTRTYDNFWAVVPSLDAVAFASQSAELSYTGMIRLDSAGVAYGSIFRVIGDLPRLPPSGLESRSVELFVKASRGNLDDQADAAIDDISVQVFYRPCWLYVPES